MKPSLATLSMTGIQKLRYLVATFLLVAAGAVFGCGPAQETGEIDPELQPYADRFAQVSADQGIRLQVVGVTLQFGPMQKERQNGLCEIRSGELPRIVINRESWDRFSDLRREVLVFHELGHCLLGRAHKDAVDPSGNPLSVMHTYTLREDTYASGREYYVRELVAAK